MSVSPTSSEPVETVQEILAGQPDAKWTDKSPTVLFNWDRAFSEKGPGQGQPPELYVWSPIDASLSQLTADGDYLEEDHTVEVQCWSLSESATWQLARDTIQIFGDYLDNQQGVSDFLTLPPTASTDLRADKQARRTEHYVATIEISPLKLNSTGTNQGTTFDMTFDSGFA